MSENREHVMGDISPEGKPKLDEVDGHVVGDLSDFPEGSFKVVSIGRREIGIFHIKGEFYGLPNICPHQTGPLCEPGARANLGNRSKLSGTLASRKETGWKKEWVHDGEIIACPWHGIEYHVPTGKCLPFPNINLRRYSVVAEDGKVKVLL